MTKKNENAAEVGTASPAEVAANATATEAPAQIEAGILVLLPTENPDEYSVRIFASKGEIKKAMNLSALPAGVLFYKGKRLETKVKSVVSL